jgi:hypothetical protein
MTQLKRCPHPKDQLTPVEGSERVTCGRCNRTFLPRTGKTPHGTYRGYCRHQQLKSGEWGWPIPEECGCRQAQVVWRTEYHHREDVMAIRRTRHAARQKALDQLRVLYPGVYAQLYTADLERRGGRVVRQHHETPVWDDILARLVKEALGRDEYTVAERIRAKLADPREREVMRQVSRLRMLLGRVAPGRKQGEP